MARKESASRVLLEGGGAVNIRVLDGLIIDDLVVQGAKAEAYRVSTGRDSFPEYDRNIRDYLIKTNVIQD